MTNPWLAKLQPYPFEKLAQLKAGIVPPKDKSPIVLSIGEPQDPPPPLIAQAITERLGLLGRYPTTRGLPELRQAIALWLKRRFGLPEVDPERQVLPVAGTREALFSFAQAVVDAGETPIVLMPNPFYQIYEGAALLAGAEPYYLNATASTGFLPDFDAVPEAVWRRCRLLYVCSPANPTGRVIALPTLKRLIEKAHRFDFVIAADECYSEIYLGDPPPSLLQAAAEFGDREFSRCVVFHSLSKRSSAPGLRSGFVAGDAAILERYSLYRTYHGCALPLPTQYASIAAWGDEAHVEAGRQSYRERLLAAAEILSAVFEVEVPEAAFYFWLKTPIDDREFARRLFATQNVTVLPGSFLARTADGLNPGYGYVRIAWVQPLPVSQEAAARIAEFARTL
ncbi:succinyldiaminopimelate transaminase [Methylothermus subterraneus]|nr:aminotransferase class I [uncultured Gammaproteobacteria bacterium]